MFRMVTFKEVKKWKVGQKFYEDGEELEVKAFSNDFYEVCYEGGRGLEYIHHTDFPQEWSLVKSKTREFWIWDIDGENGWGEVSRRYHDSEGCDTTGSQIPGWDNLIKRKRPGTKLILDQDGNIVEE